MKTAIVHPGALVGEVTPPPSKSHQHRCLIAAFLAGDRTALVPQEEDNDDVAATRRCLCALADADATPTLDCGESGSTLRFLSPVAAALGKRPHYVKRGRLAARPMLEYGTLAPGLFELPGDVSSQFATGLLFALPLLDGDSEIRFTSPLESRGYVDMTLRVLADFGVRVEKTPTGFRIPGGRTYRLPPILPPVEGDWSGAAFWYAANALGSKLRVLGLDGSSAQPDRAVAALVRACGGEIDVSGCPDLLPALAVVAGRHPGETRFTHAARLRVKESDRLAAMEDVLLRLGARARTTSDEMIVSGVAAYRACTIDAFGDHRIAMSAAVAATAADGPVHIVGAECVAKSYPSFFVEMERLGGRVEVVDSTKEIAQ